MTDIAALMMEAAGYIGPDNPDLAERLEAVAKEQGHE